MSTTSIFLFTRDLRVQDNLALNYAAREFDKIIPLFVLDDQQVKKGNSYRSHPAIQFMKDSLLELDQALKGKLNLVSGKTSKVLSSLIAKHSIDCIVVSKDYTPFAKIREKALGKIAKVVAVDNTKICNQPVLTKQGNTYTVFTPFYKSAATIPVPKSSKPPAKMHSKLVDLKLPGKAAILKNTTLSVTKGGRKQGLKLLRQLGKTQSNYLETRNYPKYETSHLSAHHKFGTISVRETYWAIQKQLSGKGREGLTRQLYWRDFYYNISDAFPHVYRTSFKEKYKKLRWSTNQIHFIKWCKGQTGFPIVDAAMRQLNTTGWMHNRARMIVASFLTKDLRISWRWGEKYFATKLVDYDPAQNNGGWQWAAGTGTDAQPYFRIFNPWTQSKAYDKDGVYIKKYVPELTKLPPKELHQPILNHPSYPKPIVDHSAERLKTLQMYKNV
jgi:deoxyribodipyrimidine photo-lyase